MASPQVENGHTDISNELIEALARIRISGEEMQILWVVFRKTYGWHKKEDQISLSQFALMTGLKRPTVSRGLGKLLSKKILHIIKNDTTHINKYRINKDFDIWTPIIKKDTTIIKKDKRVLSKMIHTKESITKETNTLSVKGKKPPSDPNIKIFIDYTFSSYKEKTGNKLLITGKDAKLVERLLPVYPLAELKALWEKFLVSEDEFVSQAGFSLGVFYSQINKLQNQKKDWRL